MMRASNFQVIDDSRHYLVDKIINNLKNGYFFTQSQLEQMILRPQNPCSGIRYKGGNRFRLMNESVEKGYKDMRWLTAKQAQKMKASVKDGEKGVICEKWIFQNQGKKNKPPLPNYYTVFNAEQIDGIEPFVHKRSFSQDEIVQIAKRFIASSECPIRETNQGQAFYSPGRDEIILPLKESFNNEGSFFITAIHEMAHSTRHPTRLNRDIMMFPGSKENIREELRAELTAMFVQADLGISLKGDHFRDRSAFKKDCIAMLRDDHHEFFRACADAEKIRVRLMDNYARSLEQKELIQAKGQKKKKKLIR